MNKAIIYTAVLLLIASGSFAQNEKVGSWSRAESVVFEYGYNPAARNQCRVEEGTFRRSVRGCAGEGYGTSVYRKILRSTTRGTYYCAVCGNLLFRSDAKFASSCGWPSFYEPGRTTAVRYQTDDSHGMDRTESAMRPL